MGNERNAAYVGQFDMPGGGKVRVVYFDFAATKAQLNQGLRRDDERYRGVGWFWSACQGRLPASAAIWHGPFTSSGSALSNAFLLAAGRVPRGRKRRRAEAVADVPV